MPPLGLSDPANKHMTPVFAGDNLRKVEIEFISIEIGIKRGAIGVMKSDSTFSMQNSCSGPDHL